MYPSPFRDDGYDIADYYSIHPSYGTMRRLPEFLDAAHARGLRVVTELVLNHTSDQHPWFQEARSSRDNPRRDWYVWSDTDDRYADVRIIFVDTENVELGVGSGVEAVLLAPLLQPPARSELRQPGGARRDVEGDEVLARARRRRLPRRRGAVSHRARGHDVRGPARDPRGAQVPARAARRALPGRMLLAEANSGPRSCAVLRRRRRVPHGVPLPADAAHVHGAAAGGPQAARRDHRTHAGDPRDAASGASSCATTTS